MQGWYYFLEGLGIAVGLIASIVVWMGYHLWVRSRGEKMMLKNVVVEFKMNIKQIDTLLEELTKCRTAVGAQALPEYVGYFDLSRCNWVTTNQMFSSGLIYKHFKEDNIDKLLGMFAALRFSYSDYMNTRVRESKRPVDPRVQAKIIVDVNYWETKFKGHKKELAGMIESLESA